MPQPHPSEPRAGWVEASGLPYLTRTFTMAIQPNRLLLAWVALLATLLLGAVLDWLWVGAGAGVSDTAIPQYVYGRQTDQHHPDDAGEHGVFEVWKQHERRHGLAFLAASVPGASILTGSPVGSRLELQSGGATPTAHLMQILYGVLWLVDEKLLYFILFGAGFLLIWSLAGGALCRSAALQFTRDEKLSLGQMVGYVQQRWLGSFFMAPLLPVIFIVMTMLCLVVGGMVLRIPVVGDILAGGAFILAIAGGFVIALLLLGLLAGGSLLWPTVAVEGSDAFDAFSRSLNYILARPFKAILYAVIAVVYGSLCWLFVHLITFVGLKFAHGVVGVGSAFFGLTGDKLERVWPIHGIQQLHAWPDWATLSWYECISAFLIGVTVLAVVALMWAFLVSFYFNASTVIYFLLRRDVDTIDLEEIHVEEDNVFGEGPGVSSEGAAGT